MSAVVNDSVVRLGPVLQIGRSWVQFPMSSFSLILPNLYSLVGSASNRREYQESSGVKGSLLQLDTLTAICKPVV
jgi:hypothetical protein